MTQKTISRRVNRHAARSDIIQSLRRAVMKVNEKDNGEDAAVNKDAIWLGGRFQTDFQCCPSRSSAPHCSGDGGRLVGNDDVNVTRAPRARSV
jgi:hypothetical protein